MHAGTRHSGTTWVSTILILLLSSNISQQLSQALPALTTVGIKSLEIQVDCSAVDCSVQYGYSMATIDQIKKMIGYGQARG